MVDNPFDRTSWAEADAVAAAETAWQDALVTSEHQAYLLLAFVEALMSGPPTGTPCLRLTRTEALTLAAAVWRAS